MLGWGNSDDDARLQRDLGCSLGNARGWGRSSREPRTDDQSSASFGCHFDHPEPSSAIRLFKCHVELSLQRVPRYTQRRLPDDDVTYIK